MWTPNTSCCHSWLEETLPQPCLASWYPPPISAIRSERFRQSMTCRLTMPRITATLRDMPCPAGLGKAACATRGAMWVGGTETHHQIPLRCHCSKLSSAYSADVWHRPVNTVEMRNHNAFPHSQTQDADPESLGLCMQQWDISSEACPMYMLIPARHNHPQILFCAA